MVTNFGAVAERTFDLISGIIAATPSITSSAWKNRRADAHDVGDRLAVANQLEDGRRNQRDGFRMIQLEPAIATLARQFARRENEELVDFAWREMHGGARKRNDT